MLTATATQCLQFETATRLLISQAITVSQVSGLFAVRQSSPRIDDIMQQYKAKYTLHGQPPEDDVLWKAWARTESVKRCVSPPMLL